MLEVTDSEYSSHDRIRKKNTDRILKNYIEEKLRISVTKFVEKQHKIFYFGSRMSRHRINTVFRLTKTI